MAQRLVITSAIAAGLLLAPAPPAAAKDPDPSATKPAVQLPAETRRKLEAPVADPGRGIEAPKCQPRPVRFDLASRTVTKEVVNQTNGITKVRYHVGASHAHIQRVTVRGTLSPGPGTIASLEARLRPDRIAWTIVWNDSDWKQAARMEIHAFGDDGCHPDPRQIDWVAMVPAGD